MNFIVTSRSPLFSINECNLLSVALIADIFNEHPGNKWVYTLNKPDALYCDIDAFKLILEEITIKHHAVERNFHIWSRVPIPILRTEIQAKETHEYGEYKYYKKLNTTTDCWFGFELLAAYAPNITLFRFEK